MHDIFSQFFLFWLNNPFKLIVLLLLNTEPNTEI